MKKESFMEQYLASLEVELSPWSFSFLKENGEGYWSKGWMAYDNLLGSHVFLKEFRRERWKYFEEYIESSLSEYKTMLCLKPSIFFPRPLKYIIHEDIVYIAMVYLSDYFQLANIYKNCKCDVKEAIYIAINILQGLQDIHESGFYHGDVQMRNILSHKKYQTSIQIVDFGQLMIRDKQGFVSGKVNKTFWGYTPPEQYRGQFFDSSDAYGVICIFIRLITGKDPFPTINFEEEIQVIQKNIPSWNIENRTLLKVMQKALSFEPTQRFATLEELKYVLRSFNKGSI